MANGKIPHSISRALLTKENPRLEDADLSEHTVHSAQRNTMAFEIDESDLFESVHNFVGCFPLLRKRGCMSVFAEINQRDSEGLI